MTAATLCACDDLDEYDDYSEEDTSEQTVTSRSEEVTEALSDRSSESFNGRGSKLNLDSNGGVSITRLARDNSAPMGDADTWTVFVYMCGSDLESENGLAVDDIEEMANAYTGDNVRFVVQTGGSTRWNGYDISADSLQRFEVTGGGVYLVDEVSDADMGQEQTLEDFLRWGVENYPADKMGVVFWNHGGGSVSGASFDELYDLDSLTLSEMYSAFVQVWEPSNEPGQQPLELVGFDTCLMATVDTAYTFCDLAKYLVASEETEPANGWYYSQWVGTLAKQPAMDGAALGRVICDAYYEGCELVGTEDNTTLSVTDLSKMGDLLDAYESFGKEALAAACADPGFFSQMGRVAAQTENYGGNTREQGYTNMVDLGHMARCSTDLLPSAQAVLDALDQCVLYRVNGVYRTEATGLSCYYSYNGDVDDLNGYIDQGAGTAFKYFYSYELTGGLSQEGMDYVADMNVEELPEVENLTAMGWDGIGLTVDDDGVATMTLGPKADSILTNIGFTLLYVDAEQNTMLLLGTDNDMNADWKNGVFSDNFRGVWGSIDGCLVYMELSYAGEDYNLYSVPVLLNDEECNLQVAYDFNEEEWIILGARQGIDDTGMADKELRQLEIGDELTILWYMDNLSSDEDNLEAYAVETITVTENTAFGECELPDGDYVMMFEMQDAMGNYAYSDGVMFTCEGGGEIYTSTL